MIVATERSCWWAFISCTTRDRANHEVCEGGQNPLGQGQVSLCLHFSIYSAFPPRVIGCPAHTTAKCSSGTRTLIIIPRSGDTLQSVNARHYFQNVLFIRTWNSWWYICRGSILFILCKIFRQMKYCFSWKIVYCGRDFFSSASTMLFHDNKQP